MSEDDVVISRVLIDDIVYYIQCVWKTQSLFVKVFVDDESWSGDLTAELIRELSSEALESEDVYFENLKKVFGVEKEGFELDFKKKSHSQAELIWKKSYKNAVEIYGSVALSHAFMSDKNSLFDELISQNAKLREQLSDSTKKVENLSKELSLCKRDWEEDVKTKENTENVLYGHFIRLLNTKKRKIHELQEALFLRAN